MRNVSTGRVIWIIWCCAWAGFWVISGISYYETPANRFACALAGVQCHQPGWIIPVAFLLGAGALALIRLPVGASGADRQRQLSR